MHPFYSDVEKFFVKQKQSNRIRTLEEGGGIDLCSNDYLCLSENSELKAALVEGVEKYGAGSTASRLIRGHRNVFHELEEKFSEWVKAPASLFFSNGYAANVGALSSICDPSYLVFVDRAAHASLLDGIRLSAARKIYFRHNDLLHLAELLKKNAAAPRKIIVTETLFSMDGDRAPLDKLVELKEQYNALLYVDDAHAIGVYGAMGAGFSSDEKKIDFRMATFGKAFGLEGAMISCSTQARQFLIHSARTFVFSTAPLPAIAYAGLTAIRLIQGMNLERKKIQRWSDQLRTRLNEQGFSTGFSDTHIIPVICQSEAEALDFASRLMDSGLHVKAIRPPTVRESRLRISVNSGLCEPVLERLANILLPRIHL